MKKIIFITISLISFSASYAQRYRTSQPSEKSIETLPQIAIDTLDTEKSNTKIVIFSNNTWHYLYTPTDIDKINSNEFVVSHWDTTQVFAYKDTPYSALPPIVELKLINNVDDFHAPTIGSVFSKYGPRRRRNHNGVDISMRLGEPLYATFEGKIRYARYNFGGFGYLVIIRHTNGLESWYGHLSRLNVACGDVVKAGQVIGFAGNTGRSRGNHLHYEMRYKDQTFDPEFLIDFENGLLRYEVFALEKSFFNINSHASEILEDADDDYVLLGSMLSEASDSAAYVASIAEKKVEAQRAEVSQSSAVYHTVRQGDMLGKIAGKYGVSIDQLCRLNKITRTTVLRLGQKLRVK